VDGYLRYEFAKKTGIEIQILEKKFASLEEIFIACVSLNTSLRELHLLEKAHLIVFATQNKLILDMSALLKNKVQEHEIACAKQIFSLPLFYFSLIQSQKLSFEQVSILLDFSQEELALLEPIFTQCRFSQSNFYLLLQYIRHFIETKSIPLQNALQSAEVLSILQDSSPYEKGENLLQYFLLQIKPLYSLKLLQFRQLKPNNLDIEFNPNFEDDFYKISFKIKKPEDVEKAKQQLEMQEKNLKKISQLLS
jgi:hypothetical protein